MAEVAVNVTLQAILIRRDGSREDLGSLLDRPSTNSKKKKIRKVRDG